MTAGSNRDYSSPATAIGLTGSDQQATTGDTILLGYMAADDAPGTPLLNFYNGTDNTGTFVASARKADGDHETFWFGPNGIHLPDGLFIEVLAGTPTGSVYVRQ